MNNFETQSDAQILTPARRWGVAIAMAGLALMCVPATLLADAVKVNRFWIDNVVVQDISDGSIIYTNNLGSEIIKPLEEVGGIRMTDIPELEKALEEMEKQNWQAAERSLRAAARKARADWLQNYIAFQLMRTQDQQGDLDAAVQAYLALDRQRVDDYYLKHPPLTAAANPSADEGALAKAAQRLEQNLPRMRGVGAQGGAQIMGILQQRLNPGGATPGQAPAAGGGNATPAQPGTSAMPGQQPASGESAIVMSRMLTRESANDPVTQLLRQGKFQEALDMSEKILGGQVNQMGMRLYQQGLAQLGLADQTGDADLYKDAGISFIRVVIYYPGGAMTPASLMEAAYVHEKIGREDLAGDMYQQASLRIDEEDEPELYQRLMKLRGIEVDQADQEEAAS